MQAEANRIVAIPKNDFLHGLEYLFEKYGYTEVYGSHCFDGNKWTPCDFAVNAPDNNEAYDEITSYIHQRTEYAFHGDRAYSDFYFELKWLERPFVVYKDGTFYADEKYITRRVEIKNDFLDGLRKLFDKYGYTLAYGDLYDSSEHIYTKHIALPYHFNGYAMKEISEYLKTMDGVYRWEPACLIGDYVLRREDLVFYKDGKFYTYQRGVEYEDGNSTKE